MNCTRGIFVKFVRHLETDLTVSRACFKTSSFCLQNPKHDLEDQEIFTDSLNYQNTKKSFNDFADEFKDLPRITKPTNPDYQAKPTRHTSNKPIKNSSPKVKHEIEAGSITDRLLKMSGTHDEASKSSDDLLDMMEEHNRHKPRRGPMHKEFFKYDREKRFENNEENFSDSSLNREPNHQNFSRNYQERRHENETDNFSYSNPNKYRGPSHQNFSRYDRGGQYENKKENFSYSSPDKYNHGLPGIGKRYPKGLQNKDVQGEVIFGRASIRFALQSERRKFHKLFVKKEFTTSNNAINQQILDDVERRGIPIESCIRRDLDTLSQYRPHHGFCMDVSSLELENHEYTMSPDESNDKQLWLVLDSVQDPMNFGGIIRTAYYLGADKIFTVKAKSCALSPVVSKASSGILEVKEIYGIDDLSQFLQHYRGAGWQVAGTVGQRNSNHQPLSDLKFSKNTIVLIGNEGFGLSEGMENYMDVAVSVSPRKQIHEGLDSLNVSVATGIILHHLTSNEK